MGVKKYQTRRGTRWMVDATVMVDGKEVRIRRKGIPTKEQAIRMETQVRKEAYDGEHFGVVIERRMTVAQAWEFYAKVCERDNRSWKTEQGRFNKLAHHLGSKQCSRLSQEDVDAYRNLRLEENTVRGKPPAKSSLDREVELLKRILNYAVKCRRLKVNPSRILFGSCSPVSSVSTA